MKKLLSFGYRISGIFGIDYISFSNYKLSCVAESRWKKKLSDIKKMIDNGELQCILFVITNVFIQEIEKLNRNDFLDLINICKRVNCIVAVQSHFLNDEPLYFDSYQGKYVNSDYIVELIIELEKEGNDHPLVKYLYETRIPSFIKEDEDGNQTNKTTFDSDSLIRRYTSKLELLKETSNIFLKAKDTISLLEERFGEIVPFQYINQVVSFVKEELEDKFSNEILNIYIPKKYGFTLEFEDFIQLFERYLKSVEKLDISIEIQETIDGTNYRFISLNRVEKLEDLPNKFNRFSNFMDLCENEPEHAMKILEAKNISASNAIDIVHRLSKKYKRLVLDIQQQKERLELAFKQELQSELFEVGYRETPFSLVENNFSSKTFENVYNPTEEEKKIIKLIEIHVPDQEISQVKSNLGVIKDPGISKDNKYKAGFRLKKILKSILRKGIEHAEKIIVETAINYVNNKIQ